MSLLLLITLLFSETPDGTQLSLRLLETTDLHGNMLGYDYFKDEPSLEVGLSRTVTLIKRARAEVENHVLVDNGDLIQGTPLADYMANRGLGGEVHPIFKIMNTLDYDVGNLGNHEFNYGLPFLDETIRGADFPYICANIFIDDKDFIAENDKPYYQPYLIAEKTFKDHNGAARTLQIGYIGFLPPRIMQWDRDHLMGKIIVKDMVTTARRFVPEMRDKGADLIIAIPHSGLKYEPWRDGAEDAVYSLADVPGIDAILFGHAHRLFPGPQYADMPGVDLKKGTIRGVPAVMPGYWGNHLGIIDLELVYRDGAWRVTDSKSEVRPIFKREGGKLVSLADPDPAVPPLIAKEHNATLAWLREPICRTDGGIHAFFAQVRDEPVIEIINQAQLWYTKRIVQGTEYQDLPLLSAASPFKCGAFGSGDYTTLSGPTIGLNSIADLYIFPNTLHVLKLTGAEVTQWLERSAAQFHRIDPSSSARQELINRENYNYNYDVIEGLEYQIDVTQPARYGPNGKLLNPDAHRIENLTYNGKPIDLKQEFLLITNNYRALGGGMFPGAMEANVVIRAPDTVRGILTDYLAQKKRIRPKPNQNWRLRPIAGDLDIVFYSSNLPAAAAYAQSISNIRRLDEHDENGYALYAIDLSPAKK